MLRRVFQFLTQDDERLLLERTTRTEFSRNSQIVKEGSRRQAIYIIRSGMARVEREHFGRGVALARLGPEQVFGEMSFVENAEASASIIADEELVCDVINDTDLYSLLVSVPGFSARFYKSLAVTLSQRLRETSSILPPLMVEEVPQVNRFHSQHVGYVTDEDQMPAALVSAVDAFKAEMARIDRVLKTRKYDHDTIDEQVGKACRGVIYAMSEHVYRNPEQAKAIGSYVFRETFSIFMLSAFIDRAYSKPRGYAGDYGTIQMVYDDKPRGDGRLGPFIDRWALASHACRAVKNRRALITAAIQEIAAGWTQDGPMPITSLASGPAQELFDLFERDDVPPVRATCIDIDHEALAFAAENARQKGVDDRVTFAQENVIRLSRGRGKIALPPQQLIYSIGLIDYLQDSLIVTMIDWAYDQLLPGGTLILGNFDAGNPDRAFQDCIMDWQLIHRSHDDMRALFARSKFGDAPVDVRVEPAGVNLFAFCTKVG